MSDPTTPATPDPAPDSTSSVTPPPPPAPEPIAPEPVASDAPPSPYGVGAPAADAPPAYAAAPPAYDAASGAYAAAPAKPTPLLSILSLVAGGVAFLGSAIVFIPFVGWVLGLPIPIAAIILGVLGRKREPFASKGLWLTGIILGIVSLVAVIISIIGFVLLRVFSSSDYYY
jgi:hypothetical protein